jgi:hypothetical protein
MFEEFGTKETSEDRRFREDLEVLLNPVGALGSVPGAYAGLYGERQWYESLPRELTKCTEEQRQRIFSYVGAALPSISRDAGDAASAKVSHCFEGLMGRGATHADLLKQGYFSQLDAVYATLETVNMLSQGVPFDEFIRNTQSELQSTNTSIASFLQEKGIITEDFSERNMYTIVSQYYIGGGKLSNLRLERNRCDAIITHAQHAHDKAKEILG